MLGSCGGVDSGGGHRRMESAMERGGRRGGVMKGGEGGGD